MYAYIFATPVLLISYYRIIFKRDITAVIILMLSARLIMGPFMPGNSLAFNVLNVLCNYLPVVIIIIFSYSTIKTLDAKRLSAFKWTTVFVLFILLFSLLNIKYAITEFSKEILPLILFLILVIVKKDQQLDYQYLLKFFRFTFIACVVIYISPHFYQQMYALFAEGIIFKERVPMMILSVFREIPRNTGYVFDFRILGQLACLYLIVLYYLRKTKNYWDVALLSIVCILTFSRGPILILLLLMVGIYAPHRNKVTKRQLIVIASSFVILIVVTIYSFNNETIQKYINSFNPASKESAISQRGAFISYSMDRFYEKPYGNGIGSLSSSNANISVFAGYTNLHKKVPDKVIYKRVGDAYLALSLAEKGIIGFVLMLLSMIEIFYSNRDRVSLFFMIGFMLNLIGTDIPKQGFFYFTLIFIYYGISQYNKSEKLIQKPHEDTN
jgi:hypothetical protein